jgi:hypothetical protein
MPAQPATSRRLLFLVTCPQGSDRRSAALRLLAPHVTISMIHPHRVPELRVSLLQAVQGVTTPELNAARSPSASHIKDHICAKQTFSKRTVSGRFVGDTSDEQGRSTSSAPPTGARHDASNSDNRRNDGNPHGHQPYGSTTTLRPGRCRLCT